MSLYNAMRGVNPATFFMLPMLGKHSDEYPRFRDCFVDGETDPDNPVIKVYTRTGGGNRGEYQQENAEMQTSPHYIGDEDDEGDGTYAYWNFEVPGEWRNDFDSMIGGNYDHVSVAYVNQMIKVFPKLEDKFREIFKDNLTVSS